MLLGVAMITGIKADGAKVVPWAESEKKNLFLTDNIIKSISLVVGEMKVLGK